MNFNARKFMIVNLISLIFYQMVQMKSITYGDLFLCLRGCDFLTMGTAPRSGGGLEPFELKI
jgi:hypothetical protein